MQHSLLAPRVSRWRSARRAVFAQAAAFFVLVLFRAPLANATDRSLGARITPPSDERAASPAQSKKPSSKTGIEWNVAPTNVIIYLDGKKIGDAGSVKFTETRPGKHSVRLTKGDDETEMEVKVNKGEVIKFEFEFTDG